MPNRREAFKELLKQQGLPPPDTKTMTLLEDIVDEGTLGATKHVDLIFELILHIMKIGSDPQTSWQRAQAAGEFVAETRGADTPIIANSVQWLLQNLDGAPPNEVYDKLQTRAEQWTVQARQRRQRLIAVGVNLLSHARTIAIFDYSSTVAAIMQALVGTVDELTIVVFESRAIAGGKPYLEDLTSTDAHLHYVPDMALESVLPGADAALFGVESLRADGSYLNTIGSRTVARTALHYGVSTYGCTDLYKLDRRSYDGIFKAPSLRQYDDLLLAGLKIDNPISTTAPELDVVPAELTTGFITEHGVVPPQAIWALGKDLFAQPEAPA